eukprot:scaffold142637_cov37-Tisochrysis_lutea.AAC.1
MMRGHPDGELAPLPPPAAIASLSLRRFTAIVNCKRVAVIGETPVRGPTSPRVPLSTANALRDGRAAKCHATCHKTHRQRGT